MQVLCLIIGKRAPEGSNPKRERGRADKKVSDTFLSDTFLSQGRQRNELSASAASIAFTGNAARSVRRS